MSRALEENCPRLARVPRLELADLPTPIDRVSFSPPAGGSLRLSIKRDDVTGTPYGGNKVRKLEYLLARARERGATRVATFGTVASNHALATTIYAAATGLDCLCLLSHQRPTPKARSALELHLAHGTEIVRYGGPRAQRIATLRAHLHSARTGVIPMGGSSWLGVLGFVNAGLELIAQLATDGLEAPERIYVANGTMGTAAGLAIGLALGGASTEVHAVRVTHPAIANPAGMQRLVAKTVTMLENLDPAISTGIADRVRIVFRDEFFAGGYAHTDAATETAITVACEQLGLGLDSTYTGKAFAAVLADAGRRAPRGRGDWLFWHTLNSRPLPAVHADDAARSRLPDEFRRYFD